MALEASQKWGYCSEKEQQEWLLAQLFQQLLFPNLDPRDPINSEKDL